jgi:hypothetical protein
VVDKFEDDVLVLQDYSLLSISADGTNFKMHRLVQLATQHWLKIHRQFEQWKEQFIRNLHNNFPKAAFENWPISRLLFVHAQRANAQRPEASLEKWASLLHRAAWFAHVMGNFVDCKIMAENATRTRNYLFGPENFEALESTGMLGMANGHTGQTKKAEELGIQVMETRKQVLGPNHPNTLKSMDALASTYRCQARWKEAEELGVQVMETRKQIQGLDHPNTLVSMASLAIIFKSSCQAESASSLMAECAQLCHEQLGPSHLLTEFSTSTLKQWQKYEACRV